MLEPNPVELLIVTGPLGAGKTTHVNRLLKREIEAGRKVSLLINEFGEISVDGALVDAERPELAGIENLVNGCACCNLRADMVETLSTWCSQEGRPDCIVLETTGLADPTDLVDLGLEPRLEGKLRVAGCLTIISCLTPLDHLERRPLVRRQAALASLLCVGKADVDPSLAMAWESQLRQAFKGVPILQTRHGNLPSPWDPWAGDVPTGTGLEAVDHGFTQARSISVRFDHPVDPAGLEALFLSPVQQGELLRAKGIAAFAGWEARKDGSDRWAFQVSDGRVEIMPLPLQPDGSAVPAVAVLIGRDLDVPAWTRALRELERPPAGARRKVVLK